MKFAVASSANARGQMRERQRRDRAATATMKARYPQFGSLRLVFDFSGAGPFTPAPQVNVMHPPAKAYFVFPCPHADCDGEFDLTSPIDSLARDGAALGNGHLGCPGHRSVDRKGRAACGLSLDYKIEVLPE
jgi:hypothetical protein